jgi:hypothetical protein
VVIEIKETSMRKEPLYPHIPKNKSPMPGEKEIHSIRRIATEFRKGILGKKSSKAWCFGVCAALQGYLELCGYKCRLVNGTVGDWDHYWLEYDGIIIDPTADQFKTPEGEDMPPVYIGIKPDWYKTEN